MQCGNNFIMICAGCILSKASFSFLRFFSTVSCILSRMIRQIILLGIDRSMIPLQFLHSLSLPFLGIFSTVSCILSRMIRQIILLGVDRSIIPLQFLHSLRLPFLGIITSTPVFHSVGISSLSHI